MSPATATLLKQIVRAFKGMLTAFDKWIDQKGSQP